jgi:hypothetical protein
VNAHAHKNRALGVNNCWFKLGGIIFLKRFWLISCYLFFFRFSENLKGREHSEDPGVDGKISWLRMGAIGVPLRKQ